MSQETNELEDDFNGQFPEEMREPSEPDSEPEDDEDIVEDVPEPEEPEDEGEEVLDEPEEEEEKPVKQKKTSYSVHDQIARINKEKYEALDRNRQLEQEVERLRQVSDSSAQVALKNYDDNVMHRFSAAKENYARAEESGDVQEKLNAQVELNFATGEYQNLLQMKAQYKPEAQYTPPAQQYAPAQQMDPISQGYAMHARETQTWEMNNSWMNKNSKDYDDFLANEVHFYAKQFEDNLVKAGRPDGIGSAEFFEHIDRHVNSIREQRSNSKRGLNMKTTRSPVSTNRSGRSSSQGSNASGVLTPAQADFSKYLLRAGVDRKTYEKYVKQDQIKNPQSYNKSR